MLRIFSIFFSSFIARILLETAVAVPLTASSAKAVPRESNSVLVDFSGYGCVNCRKMEGAVLDNEEIKNLITNNFVMIKLMVDDKRPLPEPIEVSENGKNILLETYGDKWSYLQRHKFSANAQPYYVVLDNDGNLISGPVSYDENISHFKDFLTSGLNP